MSPLERASEAIGDVVMFTDDQGRKATLRDGVGPALRREIARAVLLAVREPTGRNGDEIWWAPTVEIMKATGLNSVPVSAAKNSFTAMIDAILSTGELS